MIPKSIVQELLYIAHEGPMAGHLEPAKLYKTLRKEDSTGRTAMRTSRSSVQPVQLVPDTTKEEADE